MKHQLSSLIILIIAALGTPTSALAARTAFEPTTIVNGKFADDTHWYSIYVRSQKYLYVDTDYFNELGYTRLKCTTKDKVTKDDTKYLWAFVAADDGGYRMYNYALGEDCPLGSDEIAEQSYPSFGGSHPYDTFIFTQSQGNDITKFVMKPTAYADNDVYLNDLGNHNIGELGYWFSSNGATSNGSSMVFTEVEMPGEGGGTGGEEGGGDLDPSEPIDGTYTIELASKEYQGLGLYFTTEEVISNPSTGYTTYSIGKTPEYFYITRTPSGSYTIQSATTGRYAGFTTVKTKQHDIWDFCNEASEWAIGDIEGLPTTIERWGYSLAFGVDNYSTGAAVYTDKSASACSYWIITPIGEGGGEGGGTIDPDPGTPDTDAYTNLTNLLQQAQEAYDANSTYTYGDGLIRTESQLYSEFSQNDLGTMDGGDLGTLIDQDPSTYWHSYWQGGNVTPGTHYIRCTAPEDLGSFSTGQYTISLTYRETGNDHPTQFTVYGTNSLTSTGGWGGGKPGGNNSTPSWTQIGTINFNFGGRGTTSTATLSLTTAYKYLRFNCTSTTYGRGYFHMAEFQIYNGESSLSPSCPNALYPEAASTLARAIDAARQAIDAYDYGYGTITQADIDALTNALTAYRTAIPVLVSSVSLSPSSFTSYNLGSQQKLTATVLPADASNTTLSWTSSNTAVATVSPTGLVTTTGAGTCVITATSTDGSNVSATCNVTVYSQMDYSALCINEIQAGNIDQYLDPSFNYGGWIELYNSGNTDIPLDGLYIVGSNHNGADEVPFHFSFPLDNRYDYGYVPAHGFKNIWFDHYAVYDNKPITEHEAYKQVYWKLDKEGGRVALLAADGHTEICSMTYPAMPPRSSYARTTDGGDTWAWHACGTPEGTNNYATDYLAAPMQLAAPEVSIESQVTGGSVAPFTVSIPDGATLRYTTNGTTPTASSPQSKDGRFSLQAYSSQYYRFRLFQPGYLPSPVVTRSFINNKSDYPLPIIAVTTDDANLNSKEYGILTTSSVNGRPGQGASGKTNRNMDWERPVNVEYFDLKDGSNQYECVINQEADFSVAGGWTRNSTSVPPFKIKAAEQYDGHKYLHYPIFQDKPYNKNRTLQLRHETDLLDVGLQEVARRSGLYIDTQAWEPGELYINGKSMGYIPIREPNNKHFALANYGIDTDEVDVFEVSCDSNYVQSTGTPEAFDRWYELARDCGKSEEAYRELCELVDIDEYLNYMACEFYIFNTDWPWNNVKGFRGHDGKFHMVLMDVGDQAFAHSGGHASPTSSPFEYFRSWQNKHFLGYGETKFVTMFFNMMQNEEIRRRFVDTFCLVAYSVYTPDYIAEVLDDLRAKCKNWNDDYRMAQTLTTSWQNQEIRHLINLPEAGIKTSDVFTINMQSNLAEARLSVNGLPVPRQRFSGQLFAPVTLSAQAPEGYDFAGWIGATGNVLSTDADWTITTGGRQQLGSVYARFTPAATLAAVPPVRINEVSASNGIYVNEYWDRKDWLELYNTTDQPIDVAGMYLSDKPENPRKWQIPAASQGNTTSASTANTVIPAHGTLIVWCDKEAAGPQLHASFKLSAESGSTVSITAADRSWTDTMSYKPHGERQTFGRYPDGGSQTYVFSQPTIDRTNRYGSYDYLLQVEPEEVQPVSIADVARAIAEGLRGGKTLQEINDLIFRLLRNE